MKKLRNILLGLDVLLLFIAAGKSAENGMFNMMSGIDEDRLNQPIMSITELDTQDLTRKKVANTSLKLRASGSGVRHSGLYRMLADCYGNQ